MWNTLSMDQLNSQSDHSNLVLPSVNKLHLSKGVLIVFICFTLISIAVTAFFFLRNKEESKPILKSSGTSSDIYKDISVGIRNTMK